MIGQAMNSYLTALLVLLTATGIEARDCSLALKVVWDMHALEENCLNNHLEGFDTDLLEVIQTLTQSKRNHVKKSQSVHYQSLPIIPITQQGQDKSLQNVNTWIIGSCMKVFLTQINIRAPSL